MRDQAWSTVRKSEHVWWSTNKNDRGEKTVINWPLRWLWVTIRDKAGPPVRKSDHVWWGINKSDRLKKKAKSDHSWYGVTSRDSVRQRDYAGQCVTTWKEEPNMTCYGTGLANNREWWRSVSMHDQAWPTARKSEHVRWNISKSDRREKRALRDMNDAIIFEIYRVFPQSSGEFQYSGIS
jgi:hypothetical protein